MFGRKKYQGECVGYYTGEGVIDGKRFNERGGIVNAGSGMQQELYFGVNNAHASGNMRYPVYQYEVNGVVYFRAKTHVSYNSGAVAKMRGKQCRVLYDINNPGDSKAK
ncbi:MAG: hypothetical protein II931_01850 [Clostridia bacterium]|nr:hypothetical protein [Clostridia bacterium]